MLLSNQELIFHLYPAFKAIHPIMVVLSVIPLINIIFSKIRLIQKGDGKTNIIVECLKVFLFIFIIVQFTTVYSLIFKAGDALEAIVYRKLNVSKIYPHYKIPPETTLGSTLKVLYKRHKIEGALDYTVKDYESMIYGRTEKIKWYENRIEKEKNKIQNRSNGVNWSAVLSASGLTGKPYNPDDLNTQSQNLIEKWEQVIVSATSDREEFEKLAANAPTESNTSVTNTNSLNLFSFSFETALITLIVFISEIARNIIFAVRNFLCMIFYLVGPFLIAYSYFFFVGDTKDEDGMNKRTKSFLNWLILLALFPAIYALLDQIILILFYIYSDLNMLNSVKEITAFFAFYIVATISFPFLLHSLNPAGVMNGVFSTVSSLMMSSAVLSGTVSGIGGGVAKMGGSAMKLAKSNLDLIGKRGSDT